MSRKDWKALHVLRWAYVWNFWERRSESSSFLIQHFNYQLQLNVSENTSLIRFSISPWGENFMIDQMPKHENSKTLKTKYGGKSSWIWIWQWDFRDDTESKATKGKQVSWTLWKSNLLYIRHYEECEKKIYRMREKTCKSLLWAELCLTSPIHMLTS